ncbi:NEDD4-binding protein 1-like [Chironomus tepperi]|uniref:NEDD4-binding protein 1-like n=1 Tax=Chironomus tepperi TaxID=113505 RepID=UPI00391F226F
MKNKRSVKQDKQQNNGGKKRIMRRRRGKGKKNKNKPDESTAATTSNNNQQHQQNNNNQNRGNRKNFHKMNRPLKRLNNRNGRDKNRKNFKVKKLLKNPEKPNFLDALSEYKRIRGSNNQNAPSTSKDNQENLKAYQSVTVISDDDLEDGEIIEDKVTQYVDLIAESFKEVERSKNIKDIKSPDSSLENQPIFYVDKSANSFSEVPLYTSLSSPSADQMEVEDSVIIVNDTQSNSDDSVIIIEDKTPTKPQFSAGSDFIALSPIPHDVQKSPELSNKEKRRERQKARINKYKQKKMVEKVLELQSNGLLEGIAPIKVPLKLCTAVSSDTQNNRASTTNNLHAIPKPSHIAFNSATSSVNSVPLPSKYQNIPTLSQVVQSMIRPVQSVSINPSSIQNNPFRPPLNAARNPQLMHSTPVTGKTPNEREKRKILIDGSNVAMGFTASEIGKKAMSNDFKEFSAEALKQVVTYFENKGFQVKAVVPEFRVRREKSSNHSLMVELLDGNKLITTPSKSYDDLILLESAAKLDAAIVSNDLFRDVKNMKKDCKDVMDVINKRQIRYNWVFGEFILADDPYGRAGPKLDDILFK